jgi:hypothetical protein
MSKDADISEPAKAAPAAPLARRQARRGPPGARRATSAQRRRSRWFARHTGGWRHCGPSRARIVPFVAAASMAALAGARDRDFAGPWTGGRDPEMGGYQKGQAG